MIFTVMERYVIFKLKVRRLGIIILRDRISPLSRLCAFSFVILVKILFVLNCFKMYQQSMLHFAGARDWRLRTLYRLTDIIILLLLLVVIS